MKAAQQMPRRVEPIQQQFARLLLAIVLADPLVIGEGFEESSGLNQVGECVNTSRCPLQRSRIPEAGTSYGNAHQRTTSTNSSSSCVGLA